MSKRFLSGINVTGTATLNTVANAGLDTDKFLVLDAAGNIDFRTGDELKLDIGANVVSRIEHEVKLGETMTIGTPVYIGVDLNAGTNMTVYKATNATEAGSSKTIGLIASSGITNDLVEVVTEGLLEGLNTSTATKGDPVWLGVNGALLFGLANKPVAPAHMVFLGIVTRVQQNNGEIFVKVQNGFEMSEIHNYLQGNVQNNEVIVYESATSLYKPKSIPTILGYTPVPDSRTLTINGTTYDLSANRAWTITTDASARSILRYVATANQTTFTISGGYTPGLTDVYRNGVKLDNSTDFTATNGTTIVLTNGASVNDVIEVYRYQTAFLANNALRVVTEFVATAGQTTFNVTYNSGLVDVFYNGSKLLSTEYTAGNGTSIILNFPCNVNDTLEVHAYSYAVGAFTGQAQLNGTGLVRMSGTTVTYDNATYATQSYVTTAVANLVNSAPATLDTLNELATALGNDANFATTITTSIATKLPLSGGTLTGALSGTSATFGGLLTVNVPTDNTTVGIFHAGGGTANRGLKISTFVSVNDNAGVRLDAQTTAGGATLALATAGVDRLTIASTGQATFTGAYINTSDVGVIVSAAIPAINLRTASTGRFTIASNYSNPNTTSFLLGTGTNNPSTQAILLDHSTGAATFSSSVTAASYIGEASTTELRLRGGGYGGSYNTSLRSIPGAIGVLQFGNNNDNYILVGNTAAGGYLSIRVNVSSESTTSGIEAMRITSGGNVGIGTTSPNGRLTIDNPAGGNRASLSFDIYENYARIQAYGNGTSSGAIALNPLGNNVGIGTSSPSSALHIVSAASTRYATFDAPTAGWCYQDYKYNGTIYGYLGQAASIVGGGSNTDMSIVSANNLVFGAGGTTERMRITSGGIIQLGSTYKRNALEQSNFGYNGVYRTLLIGSTGTDYQTNSVSLAFNVDLSGNPSGAYGGDGAEYFWRNVGSFKTPNSSNNGYNTLLSWNSSGVVTVTTSDYRAKEDLKSFEALPMVNAMKLYDFRWIELQNRMHGVLAHELQDIVPYAVMGEKDGESMQGVDYSKLVPIMLKAIQEQQAQIEELKALIAAK